MFDEAFGIDAVHIATGSDSHRRALPMAVLDNSMGLFTGISIQPPPMLTKIDVARIGSIFADR
jgi:hypothetical protein